jgi:hypothetical protein
MSTAVMTERISEASPRLRARIAGTFYLLTFITGVMALSPRSGRVAISLIAGACYVGVTLIFYGLFKPVNRNLSFLAAFVSLVGIGMGPLAAFHLAPIKINSLVFFGIYCLLIGYLIFRSTFLPHFLGWLMVLGGLGWLTFVSPELTRTLSPYNMGPGMLAEGILTLWLLVMGVNEERWKEQASAAQGQA